MFVQKTLALGGMGSPENLCSWERWRWTQIRTFLPLGVGGKCWKKYLLQAVNLGGNLYCIQNLVALKLISLSVEMSHGFLNLCGWQYKNSLWVRRAGFGEWAVGTFSYPPTTRQRRFERWRSESFLLLLMAILAELRVHSPSPLNYCWNPI